MRIFQYSRSSSRGRLVVDDYIIVAMSVMNMDYVRWVTAVSPLGRERLEDVASKPLYGFRVKELKPKPNQIEI